MINSRFQCRLWSADMSSWRVLSGRKGAAGTVAAATWQITREEGYGAASLTLNGRKSDVSGLERNRRVEFWGRNEAGVYVRLYRGNVTRIQGRGKGSRQTRVSLYGISTRVGKQRTNQLYRYISGKDIGEAFSEIASKWAAAKFPQVIFQGGVVGQTVDSFDGRDKTLGQAITELLELTGGFAVGGGDVEPEGTRDRVGIRSFDEKPPASPPALTIKLPDPKATVSEPSPDEDGRRLANILLLKGGQDRYPNLLAEATENNPGFEIPVFGTGDGSGSTTNNRLEDPGFEDRDSVNVLTGGASFKSTNLSEGPTDGGDDMVLLDNVGEKVAQTVTGSLVPGHSYVFNTRARLTTGGLGGHELTCRLIWITGGGELVNEVPFNETSTLPLNDAIWRSYPVTAVCPPGATGARLENENTADSDDGIVVDNRSFYDASTLYQQGWEVRALGSAVITQQNLAYDADTSPVGRGAYAILVGAQITAVTADNDDVTIRPIGAAKATVQPNQSVRYSVWVKSPPGETSAPAFQVKLFSYTQAGEFLSATRSEFAAGPVIAEWTRYDCTKTVESNAASVLVSLSIRSTGALLTDAHSLRDSASDPDTYLENDQYTETLRSDTPALAETPEILASIEENGEMPEEVTVEAITTPADAATFAKAFFRARATAINKPSVKITGRALGLWPGKWVDCVGADAPDLFTGGALPIAEILGGWDGGLLTETLYLSQERESDTRTAREIARREARIRTGQSGANGATGATGGSGGGIPGTGGIPTESPGTALSVSGPDAADPLETLEASNVSDLNFSGSVELTKDGTGKIVGVNVLAGEQGEPGEPGEQGEQGEAATITIGSVTTVAPGEPATVTNVGTTSEAILNFEIPAGEDGEDGADGSVEGLPDPNTGNVGDVIIVTDDGSGTNNIYTLGSLSGHTEITTANTTLVAGTPGSGETQIPPGAGTLVLRYTANAAATWTFADGYYPLSVGKRILIYNDAFDLNSIAYPAVITPIHNRQGSLPQSGQEVLTQKGDCIELLISNGGGVHVVNVSRTPSTTRAITGAETAGIRDFGRVLTLAAGTYTVALPSALDWPGKELQFLLLGAGSVTLDPDGTETINGAGTITLTTAYQSARLRSDGVNWLQF